MLDLYSDSHRPVMCRRLETEETNDKYDLSTPDHEFAVALPLMPWLQVSALLTTCLLTSCVCAWHTAPCQRADPLLELQRSFSACGAVRISGAADLRQRRPDRQRLGGAAGRLPAAAGAVAQHAAAAAREAPAVCQAPGGAGFAPFTPGARCRVVSEFLLKYPYNVPATLQRWSSRLGSCES